MKPAQRASVSYHRYLSFSIHFWKCIALCAVLLTTTLSCRNYGDFWDKNKNKNSPPEVVLLPNQVNPPTMGTPAGIYNTAQMVMLSSPTAGATICYTADGITTPDCDAATATCTVGTTYISPVAVNPPGATLKAMACALNMINSPVATAAYTVDTTSPTITLTAPANSAYALDTKVSYSSDENCATATMVWTRTGGTTDASSPHTKALIGAELTSGTHSNTLLTNNPTLVDGAVYSVAFDCTDAAGNTATTVTSANVTYDGTPPIISAVTPPANAFVTDTQVGYSFSEACTTATITWTRTGGTVDGSSPHVKSLTGSELTTGSHGPLTITNNPSLVSGAIYSIQFDCTDAAGNTATTVTTTNVTYDTTPPVISAVSPTTLESVNHTKVSYTLSEACATATITWTKTGGIPADSGSPHVKNLTGAELSMGAHTNILITNNPTLVNGVVYDIQFNCTDAAGNVASGVTSTGVTFLNIAVAISAVAPATNAYINNTKVSYTYSAPCVTATITWTRTGGTADASSPHTKSLVAGELTQGAHTNTTITNNPTLVSGAVYDIQFDCTDAALNASTPVVVTGVTYDSTIPVISTVIPTANAFVKDTQVGYTFSEVCLTATITWTRTGGVADGSSPHAQTLVAPEMTAGTHGPLTITNNPTLVSGTVYSVMFDCTDAAGNIAGSVTSTNVTFDNVAPTVMIQNLREKSTVQTGFVIGTAADDVGVSMVEYSLDGGAWTAATYTAPDWKFALPTGVSTWRDRSAHTVQARALDAAGNNTNTLVINVRKGNNHDVNGDGYEDAAISGSGYSSNTGKGYVFYGSASGVTASTASTAPFSKTGSASSDFFSRNMVLADFNGDGYADLALAIYGDTSDRGKVQVYHGSPAGLSGTANTILTGETTPNAASRFGIIVLAADTNSDGFADLIASANLYNIVKGKVYLFHGLASGIASGIASTATRTITGTVDNMQIGLGLAVGDFNGDSYTDLAVAAPADTSVKGRVYIVNGNGSGIPTTTLTPAMAIGTAPNLSDYFGSPTASVDLNDDGVTDLIVGSYGFSAGANTGKAYIYYGVSGAGIPANQTANPGSPVEITGTNSSAYFTTVISTGDLNNDGYGDLAIGAYGCSSNPEGCAYIFYGKSTPLSSGVASAVANTTLTGQVSGENFGRGAAMLDVNGDGILDLFVGANFHSSNTGRVFIFNGTGSGPNSVADFIITGEPNTQFGIFIGR